MLELLCGNGLFDDENLLIYVTTEIEVATEVDVVTESILKEEK